MNPRRILAGLAVLALECSAMRPASAAPPARYGHSAVYDILHDRMLVFGGNDGFDNYYSDVWTLPLAGAPAWSPLVTAGPIPARRAYHCAVFDPLRDRMLILGGTGDIGALDDVWALTFSKPAVWTHLSPAGTAPSARSFHSAVYDPVRDRVLVFGGLDADGPRHDVWELSLSPNLQWSLLTPTGTPPGDRYQQSAIYDPERDRVVVFGGSNFVHLDADCIALELASGTPTWTPIVPANAPPRARDGHGAVYDPVGDRMLVFFGWVAGEGFTNDVWALSFAGTPTWTQVPTWGGTPNPRKLSGAILDLPRNRLVVFGGTGSGDLASMDDTWAMPLFGVDRWFQPIPGLDAPWTPGTATLLESPTPNPCRTGFSVRYTLANAGQVELEVYDVNGRLVRQLEQREHAAGPSVAAWDGRTEALQPATAGIYYLSMRFAGSRQTRRVVVVR